MIVLEILLFFSLTYYYRPYHIFWAVSLLTKDLRIQCLTALIKLKRIRSFTKFGKVNNPPSLTRALPHFNYKKRSTEIDFAENQLSLSLIGLSPLITNHPSILLHTRVRPSKKYYYFIFSLFMIRSLSFGSFTFDLVNLLNFTFITPPLLLSLPKIKTHWLIMQKENCHYKNIIPMFY